MSDTNPLLLPFEAPYEVPPFSDIDSNNYIPAIEKALAIARDEIKEIKEDQNKPTFDNTIEALEKSGELLGKITPILFNLNSAETNDALQKVTQEASSILTEFESEISQDPKLFERVEQVFEAKESLGLSTEQMTLLEKTYKDYVRNGAKLDAEQKAEFRTISVKLQTLGLKFGEHVLTETNAFRLKIDNEADLSGLPADVVERAAELAKSEGNDGAWHFTLQAPSFIPFMEYADNRTLREKMYKAHMTKCFTDNEQNNTEIIKELVSLRNRKAELLGYDSYAAYILEERMAEDPGKVYDFLEDLLERSQKKARGEVEELQVFAKELGYDITIERWDWAYFSEKLRKHRYDFDDEVIKPYFRLESVIEGVFKTAEKLYGITFAQRTDIPVYHSDVQAYEVKENGETIALFFADFFPRDGKRPGAWMTSFRGQSKLGDKRVIPLVSIVCNFTPSTANNPSLLKFDEVKTLFHEFGHALHGILSDTTYEELASPNVFWDFVELPSQVFENWCYEKECLDLFAAHFETGEPIPSELVDKLKASSTFHEAYMTVRQLSFGLLDMAYHHLSSNRLGELSDIRKFEQDNIKKTDLFNEVPNTCMSTQFSHIFAGGYAAGYYSYKWAEVLDADAFAAFQENGIFDQETASAFRKHVLSAGRTEHPMVLYKRFRGKEPSPQALLVRAGLK
ncbi:MAG: M3 family metallopeptidase [Cytophagales bacterium]|nr:M3 family metallopeptidase [Cytophagales bacterium]